MCTVTYLEEPVLVEGEADGGGVVEGDEGGRLEDEAASRPGLWAAAAGPPASRLLLNKTDSFINNTGRPSGGRDPASGLLQDRRPPPSF